MRSLSLVAAGAAVVALVGCGGSGGGGSGVGDGTYAAGTAAILGAVQGDIALADTNNDGRADLLLLRGGLFPGLVVRRGTSSGFDAEDVYATDGDEPQALATGDFNDDGFLDVLAWAQDGTIDHFEAASIGGGGIGILDRTDLAGAGLGTPRGLKVGRLTGDADEDVLAQVTSSLHRYDGTAGTAFSTSVDLSPSGFLAGMALADLDGDGQDDLAGVNFFGQVVVAENNGLGGFFAGTTHTLPSPATSATGSGALDGVAGTDLVVGLQTTMGGGVRLAVLPNLANGSANVGAPDIVTVTLTEDANVVALVAADIDENGATDVVVATATHVYVMMNGGGGAFALRQTLTPGGTIDAIAVGDIDGDGILDVAVRVGSTATPYFGNEQ
jgi:hypothetical protein